MRTINRRKGLVFCSIFVAAYVCAFFVSAETISAATATDGMGTMNVNSANVSSGTVQSLKFTFAVPTPGSYDFQNGSTVTFVIPASWSAPQKTASGTAGYVTVSDRSGNCPTDGTAAISISGNTLTIAGNCHHNDSFILNYNNAAAPNSPGLYTFTTSSDEAPLNGSGGAMIAVQPTVTITDNAPPTTTDNVPSAWQTSATTVTFTCNDGAGSGCSKVYYTTNGSAPATSSSSYVNASSSWQFAVSSAGTYAIKYFGVDNANNSESVKTAANALKIAICGNGIVELGEQCDGGACCDNAKCQFKTSYNVCRASAGVCDTAESCTGLSASCPSDVFQSLGTSCSDGLFCNGAETCDGSGQCSSGTPISCSENNISGVNTCVWAFEGNPWTFDVRNPFTSVCDENTASCTTGDSTVTSTCNKSACEAQCELGNSQSCQTESGYSGTQDCSAGCAWNSCQTNEKCGDGIKNGNEQCDGADGVSNNQSCSDTCIILNSSSSSSSSLAQVAVGGGGGGGGGGVLIPPEPVLEIANLLAPNVLTNSLTLTWATNFASSSYVIYSAEGEAHSLNMADNSGNPPKYGYANATEEIDTNPKVMSHSVTIAGLNPLTTYYFRVVSRGSLAVGGEYKVTTPGVAGVETENIIASESSQNSSSSVAAVQIEQVIRTELVNLSESQFSSSESSQSSSLSAVSGNTNPFAASLLSVASKYFWLLLIILMIFTATFVIYYFIKRKK